MAITLHGTVHTFFIRKGSTKSSKPFDGRRSKLIIFAMIGMSALKRGIKKPVGFSKPLSYKGVLLPIRETPLSAIH